MSQRTVASGGFYGDRERFHRSVFLTEYPKLNFTTAYNTHNNNTSRYTCNNIVIENQQLHSFQLYNNNNKHLPKYVILAF